MDDMHDGAPVAEAFGGQRDEALINCEISQALVRASIEHAGPATRLEQREQAAGSLVPKAE